MIRELKLCNWLYYHLIAPIHYFLFSITREPISKKNKDVYSSKHASQVFKISC